MRDEEVKKIVLYKFYVDGKEKKFKDPIVIEIKTIENILVFCIEEGDLKFHTIADTIDEGLKNVLEILEINWKDYALGELGNLRVKAKKYGKYLRSLVE